jgi:predicted DNA-binding protein YlxM (UPF0122 family)
MSAQHYSILSNVGAAQGSGHLYYQQVTLTAAGTAQVRTIAAAQEFIQQHCSELLGRSNCDKRIQQRLVHFFYSSHLAEQAIAVLCLRCYISHQIKQSCIELVNRFGASGRFSLTDLLPLVLSDAPIRVNPSFRSASWETTSSSYRSLTDKILQTFNPACNTCLSTWTKRLVLSDATLNAFLEECGIYLISDWAMLNDTTPKKLRRLLAEVYSATAAEILYGCHLLESYHAVYRQQLRQLRLQGHRGKCPLPTENQLQQIAQVLQEKANHVHTSQRIFQELQTLARKLRQRYPTTASLDLIEPFTPAPHEEDSLQDDFLFTYRQAFVSSLDRAIAQVISDRLQQLQLQNKRQQNKHCDRLFLTALTLFYVEDKSMTEIASLMGMGGQSQISRLLKLNELRTDIRHQLLLHLKAQVPQLTQEYVDPDRLATLDDQLANALAAETERVVAADETAARTVYRSSRNLFAQRMCYYLAELAPISDESRFHPDD